ncbi:MAG TPA: YbhB/YbcL family Raf kinase inhibitor-like protein [Stenomitos sp.]
MRFESRAFETGRSIPEQYACDGQNVSPELHWQDVPEGTESLAIICDDPDAPRKVWVHWVLYDLPAKTTHLAEQVPPAERLPTGGTQGRNDFGTIGYGGPCPPSGTHRYVFQLYALDRKLGLQPGATKQQVLKAMQGHVIAEAQLTGTYTRH